MTEEVEIEFRCRNGADGRFRFPETFGSGCCFLDVDGDGWMDLFLVNGCPWPDRPGRPAFPALYRNDHHGRFRDVTQEAGLAVQLHGMGCAVGDYDNDGHDDLLVTCVGGNRLFRNEGDGRFREVTQKSGLGPVPGWAWSTSAAWFDYDRDGLLDLFICRYVRWAPGLDPTCRSGRGQRTYCSPSDYQPTKSSLYRNLGQGRFQDVSASTGIAGPAGKALGVLPLDYDRDGWCDLFIANDQAPNFLFKNLKGKRFQELGQESGIALSASGVARAGMGIDSADVWNDGGEAVAVGNFSGEGLALFRNEAAIFTDEAQSAGLVPASLSRLTFGLAFLDADRDGWQDLFTYNGHVDPQAAARGAGVTYRQAPQLFRNERGRFREVTETTGPAFHVPQLGRGCAVGDFDNDGQPDLLLNQNQGKARLLRNVTNTGSHWLGVHLRGTKGNRNGYGAEVRLLSGGKTQRRWVRSGASYLSQNDPRLLFGLGECPRVDRLEVHWPSGSRTVREDPQVDRYTLVEEE